MSEASRRAAEEVVTKLWVLSLHEQRVEVVAAAIARAVEGERVRVMAIFDDHFAPDDDDPMVSRCRAALRAPGEKA